MRRLQGFFSQVSSAAFCRADIKNKNNLPFSDNSDIVFYMYFVIQCAWVKEKQHASK